MHDPVGPDERLARQFADVATQLSGTGSASATLQRIADLASEVVGACDHAGVTLVEDGVIRTLAHSDEVARALDDAQHRVGQGPCLEVILSPATVLTIDDLPAETRWPAFVGEATATGVRSVVSVLLQLEDRAMGSLNLYSDGRDAFDAHDRAVAALFAVHAAVALRELDHLQHLRRAIETRDLIGQAKGILMAREGVDAATAFDMLVRASQHTNRKLREIAEAIVEEADRPSRTAAPSPDAPSPR